MKVLIYDTETGGLDPEVHSVFSLGALVGDLDTGQVLEQFEALHKLDSIDDYNFTDKAIEVHGITPTEAFTKGVETTELQDRFVDLWNSHGAEIIGGHNEAYDRRMMAFQIFKCTLPEFEANFTYRSIDSSSISRLWTGNNDAPSGATLKQVAKAMKIDLSDIGKDGYHGALYDTIVCFRILCKIRTVLIDPQVAEKLKS